MLWAPTGDAENIWREILMWYLAHKLGFWLYESEQISSPDIWKICNYFIYIYILVHTLYINKLSFISLFLKLAYNIQKLDM